MRHADLRRETAAVIAKAVPALLYDTAVWYLVWGRGGGVLWWDERSDEFKTCFRLTFSTGLFDWTHQSKK